MLEGYNNFLIKTSESKLLQLDVKGSSIKYEKTSNVKVIKGYQGGGPSDFFKPITPALIQNRPICNITQLKTFDAITQRLIKSDSMQPL